MLEIKNLSVNIDNKQIIKDLNLSIKKGEIHALMGKNGAGKSTLVKAISKHYDCEITEGEITYKNKNLKDLEVNEICNEGIFLSFQNPIEIPGVNNNYFLKAALNAKREYSKKEPLDALEFLKTMKTKMKEFNIDDSLLKRDLNAGFSGGEKKRNELIQIITLEPDLILLDEIDSGLDVDAIKIVAQVINKLLDENKSVLMITHYNRLLKLIKPDFVHIIQDGQIVKTGNYSLALQLDKKGFDNLGDL